MKSAISNGAFWHTIAGFVEGIEPFREFLTDLPRPRMILIAFVFRGTAHDYFALFKSLEMADQEAVGPRGSASVGTALRQTQTQGRSMACGGDTANL